MKKFLSLLVIFVLSILLVSCLEESYTITFDTNGGSNIDTIIFKDSYDYKKISQFTTTKEGFLFVDWYLDKSLDENSKLNSNITKSVILYAKWEEEVIDITEYTITWKSEGVILKEDIVEAGKMPQYTGDIPTKEETLTHTFTFIGWDTEIVIASGNKVYNALFESTLKQEKTEINYTELNTIFKFNIYNEIPKVLSNDYVLINYSETNNYEVYIDIFDWSEEESLNYIENLNLLLPFDETEDAWNLGVFFIYVYEDDEMYPGSTIYGIAIYGITFEEEPSEGIEDVYYSFNIQNTITELSTSYKNETNKEIKFNDSLNKAIIKVNHLAHITHTASAGLDVGYIFAANVKDIALPNTYLEIDTLGNDISKISFIIQAKTNFDEELKDAKLQVFIEGNWIDLEGGNFYSEITTNNTLVTISNINASKFRLLFTGSGRLRNGGQFKIYNVTLYENVEEVIYEDWLDLINDLSSKLNLGSLENILEEITNLSELKLEKVNNKKYLIKGTFTLNAETSLNNYIDDLLTKGFILNNDLSSLNKDVYTLYLDDDLAYAVSFNLNDNDLVMEFSYYDPVVEEVALETLDPVISVNEYEVNTFGMSGLPSVGTYNVLVVPVEIKGTVFPMNYYNNLNLVFNGTSLDTGYESVSSYYYKSSYGKLNLTFDIAPKITTSNTKSYYENIGDEGDQYAIVETLRMLDPEIDFSIYDTNNDGLIDSVIFIYSVNYNGDIDPWWAWVYSAKYGYANDLENLDGKRFEYYFWASYDFVNDSLVGNNITVNAETYIHELGHLMGMPDLYSYNESYNYGPLGGFDMMDHNVGDHGPFNKLIYGWLEPLVATKGEYEVTLDSYSLDNDGKNNTLLIPYNEKDLLDGDAFDEYLLIMFYTPNGLYESYLNAPFVLNDAAIVVYHVDARLNNNNYFWSEYFVRNNDGSNNFLVSILEADYNKSLPSRNTPLSSSDVLRNGSFDLSSYNWHQGGGINVLIEISEVFNNSSEYATINVTVS